MRAAVAAHIKGQTMFTQRMAINIADHFGMTPMECVRYCERHGLVKPGAATWFRRNGGITRDNIAQVRRERAEAARRARLK